MQLYYTPYSHFARKVRLLLAALGQDVELIDAGNTADINPVRFGPNPLLAVPALIDGDQMILDSDTIAAWLVRRFDPADRFRVLTHDIDTLNARAVLNGIMAAEVELLLARRAGLDVNNSPRWDKKRAVIGNGLAWLEARASLFSGEASYLGFHLLACWEHLLRFRQLPDMPLPGLAKRVHALAELPFAAQSSSLAPTTRIPVIVQGEA